MYSTVPGWHRKHTPAPLLYSQLNQEMEAGLYLMTSGRHITGSDKTLLRYEMHHNHMPAVIDMGHYLLPHLLCLQCTFFTPRVRYILFLDKVKTSLCARNERSHLLEMNLCHYNHLYLWNFTKFSLRSHSSKRYWSKIFLQYIIVCDRTSHHHPS